MQDLTGKRFGMWTVLRATGERECGSTVWLCRCDCGTERGVRGSRLNAGKSNGCGCMRQRTHGQTDSPTYRVWRSMILRCEAKANASYKHYGAKGVKVCERWRHSFENFLADMGERKEGMTIDRIDNARDYEPGNCRWATTKQQNRHRRGIKLTEEAAAEIRLLYADGHKQEDIATAYGITASLVSMVVTGRIWT